jgi:hypothetical protein
MVTRYETTIPSQKVIGLMSEAKDSSAQQPLYEKYVNPQWVQLVQPIVEHELVRIRRQVGEGALDLRIMYLATVAWLISMPSLRSSPWIRGAPQSGLALLICRIV